MKVLILPSWYPDENNELNGIFFKEQAEALNKRDIDISVLSINILSLKQLCNKRYKRGLSISKENGIKVYRYYTYNYFPKITEVYLRYYGSLIRRLINKIAKEQGNFDLVHIHSAIDAGIAYKISNLKIPYVITEHSTKYERDIINLTQKKYLFDVFKNANRVLVVGAGLKKELTKYINDNKIEILPNMVSINKLQAVKDEDKDRFRFFSLGLLTKKKGMDVLINAFNNNVKLLEGAQLFIGGDGEEYDNLKAQIEKNKLGNYIKLLGRLSREDVAYHMSNCDCFVLASRFETFGIVFLEAMLYGKPVIATKTGGPDIFVNEKNGVLIQPDDIEELSNVMVSMLEKASKYDSEFISDFCYDNFGEEVISNKIIDIYKDILNKNRVN